MDDTTPGAGSGCPPHHWNVTLLRTVGATYHHHHCIKCDAEKDVPVVLETARPPWRLNAQRPKS